jgi:hypothetical protein
MYFSFAVALAAFPFLVGAVPVENSRRDVLSIPLSKRWLSQLDVPPLPSLPGTRRKMTFVLPVLFAEKGGSLTKCVLRKLRRGFEASERNIRKRHPLAPKHGRSDKRSVPGNVPLTDFNEFMWYGTIQVGTPSKEYSGRSLFEAAQLSKLIT